MRRGKRRPPKLPLLSAGGDVERIRGGVTTRASWGLRAAGDDLDEGEGRLIGCAPSQLEASAPWRPGGMLLTSPAPQRVAPRGQSRRCEPVAPPTEFTSTCMICLSTSLPVVSQFAGWQICRCELAGAVTSSHLQNVFRAHAIQLGFCEFSSMVRVDVSCWFAQSLRETTISGEASGGPPGFPEPLIVEPLVSQRAGEPFRH